MRWIGGRDHYQDMTGEYVPTNSWSWTARLIDPSYGSERSSDSVSMRVELHAFAIRDYGRGRRVYSWRAVATFGRASIPLGSGRARSQRAVRRAVDERIGEIGRSDLVAQLWSTAWSRRLARSIWTDDDEPAMSVCGALWSLWGLPSGTWLAMTPDRHDRSDGGRWFTFVDRSWEGLATRGVRDACVELEPWTGP